MLMFSLYIIGIVYNLLYCYLFCKIMLKKKFLINKRIIIIDLILAIFLAINFYYNKTPLKPFVSNFFGFVAIKIAYRESLWKSLCGLLIVFIVVSLSEFLFATLLVYGFKVNQTFLNNTVLGLFTMNIGVMIISIIICNIRRTKHFINSLINGFNNKTISLLFIVIFCLSIVTLIIYQNFYISTSGTYFILINIFFLGVYVLMIGFFVEKSNNNNLMSKYDQLYQYSKTYEKELTKRSKRQHEYKNQLIIIKSMIEEKDKETINYIDGLLQDELNNDDIRWLDKLANIPLGGLKGLLYFKINQMVENKIIVNLNVSEKLSKKSLWKTYLDMPQDISKIIGVYLDNAIEAASIATKKEIEIQIYLENKNIIFSLGNTYEGEIDENKINKEGYSSRGSGRGYGLLLVKDLLSKHSELEQERTIMNQYYIQNLIIKTK